MGRVRDGSEDRSADWDERSGLKSLGIFFYTRIMKVVTDNDGNDASNSGSNM